MQPERGIANTVITAWLNLLTQDKVQLFIKTYFHSVQTLNLLSFLIKKTNASFFLHVWVEKKKNNSNHIMWSNIMALNVWIVFKHKPEYPVGADVDTTVNENENHKATRKDPTNGISREGLGSFMLVGAECSK